MEPDGDAARLDRLNAVPKRSIASFSTGPIPSLAGRRAPARRRGFTRGAGSRSRRCCRCPLEIWLAEFEPRESHGADGGPDDAGSKHTATVSTLGSSGMGGDAWGRRGGGSSGAKQGRCRLAVVADVHKFTHS
jgi:hypothetical protein